MDSTPEDSEIQELLRRIANQERRQDELAKRIADLEYKVANGCSADIR